MVGKNDILKQLASDAFSSVESGCYDVPPSSCVKAKNGKNLSDAIRKKNNLDSALVCEIKFASPSAGNISNKSDQVSKIAKQMQDGGASALSVLTEKKSFHGSISNLIQAREATGLPIIMKDVVVSREQVDSGSKIGADAILLIYEVFEKNLTRGFDLNEAISYAHKVGLEVIVETCSARGFELLLDSDCDVIGINNRDLETFNVRLDTTVELLQSFSRRLKRDQQKLVMSESGYESPQDVSKILNVLHSSEGVLPSAFLIGTSIMRSNDVEAKVREFASILRIKGEERKIAS